jgi:FkbM family methyltransferase
MMRRLRNKVSAVYYQSLYLLRRAGIFFSEPLNGYGFGYRDRKLGSFAMLEGYGPKPVMDRAPFDHNHDRVKIEAVDVFVPKELFKGNELAYIYVETFGPWESNPHAFEHPVRPLRSGDVVIDAGACEGFFTMLALQRGAREVHLFEPTFDLCQSLEMSFKNECADDRVKINRSGLFSSTGSSNFEINHEHASMSRLGDGKGQEIKLYSLDDYVEEQSIARVNFIKMDIEGAEVEAIEGARKTLFRDRPVLSIAVYHQYENAALIRDIFRSLDLNYRIVFGGCFMFVKPHRPYMLYAIPA